MSSLFNKIINNRIECRIFENSNYIEILSKESDAQENYIRIGKLKECFRVEMVHRNDVVSICETREMEQAEIVAAILALNAYEKKPQDENIALIREYIKNDKYEEVVHIINSVCEQISYKIYEENAQGLSLVQNNDLSYTLSYMGKIVMENMNRPRAFSVLYAYCRDLEYFKNWYSNNLDILEGLIEYDLLETVYLGFY